MDKQEDTRFRGMKRQGDVLIISLKKRPKGATKSRLVPRDSQNRVILAEGEATGHAHAIQSDTAMLYHTDDMLKMYFYDESENVLRHEEHNAHTIASGWSEVRRQREYRPGKIVLPVID